MAQWVPWLSEFLFSSMFAEEFSYLANNFYVIARAVGSSFSPGLLEIDGKINFPNMFANTMFVSDVREYTRSDTKVPGQRFVCSLQQHCGMDDEWGTVLHASSLPMQNFRSVRQVLDIVRESKRSV